MLDGALELGQLYDSELVTAQSEVFSDAQRDAFGMRWLGVVRSQLERWLCYQEQPATGVTQQLAAKLKMALATVDASSDKAQLLSKRIAELEVREQEMAVAATSLKEQLTAVHRLKTELLAGAWKTKVASQELLLAGAPPVATGRITLLVWPMCARNKRPNRTE